MNGMDIVYSSFTTSPTIGEITKAFIAAKRNMGPLKKGAANPFFKSKYADLASVIEVSEDTLLDEGIATLQGAGGDGDAISVTTFLAHTSGEWFSSVMNFNVSVTTTTKTVNDLDESTITETKTVKHDPQAAGSTLSYLRRYSLQAMCNLAAEDDDGNAAHDRTPTKAPPKPVAPPKPPNTPTEPLKMQQRTQGRLFALLSERGLMDTRREWATEQGLSKESFTQLTEEDAKFLIKRLEAMPPLPDYAGGKLL